MYNDKTTHSSHLFRPYWEVAGNGGYAWIYLLTQKLGHRIFDNSYWGGHKNP